ncbi:MAG: DUF5687 family protein [Prevotellaceae bacterium]|nr:DUF5687 family protein [Prevotella sp.]MDD7257183.1 DUF5687 family protein [Prevotellaceae bacterium]MDY6130381.1 DUF5687 family protein [Prevotella sp.]
MNRYELFRTLRKHVKLSEKRSPVYEQNKASKYIIYTMSGFAMLYLIFISVMLSLIANGNRMCTTSEFLFGLLPFILTVDFLFRFMGQQTPSQLIKPYILLPLPKYACVESFIVSSIITPNNFIWMFITVPYAIMTILFSTGFWAALGVVVAFQLIVIVNSLNYMLWRTLIIRHIGWFIAPVVFYGLIYLPWLLVDIDALFSSFACIGEWAASWNPLVYLGIFTLMALFFYINRWVQYHFTYIDTTSTKNTQLKTVSEFNQLNRFGEMGEYLKLEVKSIMRNKNMRNSFLYSTIFTIILSIIISYTNIYDDGFSSKFFIVYVFIINGAMLLVKVMGAEGNYIDGLMVHKENILQLLHAKYYFYSTLLLLPFLIMIPTVIAGKYSLLLLVSMVFFAAGPIFCIFMQMAVWQKQTLPLNSKMVSKGNVETNWFAFGAEMAAMFAPVAIISIFDSLFNSTVTAFILLGVGIFFVATRNLWIRNIYNRFMKKRYENMESFRATR